MASDYSNPIFHDVTPEDRIGILRGAIRRSVGIIRHQRFVVADLRARGREHAIAEELLSAYLAALAGLRAKEKDDG